ncbi:MAG: hypothetical protein Q619_VDC00010G0001, partial [Veillonella dispar DORA_11]
GGLCTHLGVPIPASCQTQTERSDARTLQLRAKNASPHQTQPKPSSRGRTIYRLERPNEITRWTVKVEIGGWREIWKRRIGV